MFILFPLVQITYRMIKLPYLLIGFFLALSSYGVLDLESPRTIQPRQLKLTLLLLRAFSIVRRLLGTSHEEG